MWFPFFRKKKKLTPRTVVKRVIVGFIIGSAITSIIGQRMMRQKGNKDPDEK